MTPLGAVCAGLLLVVLDLRVPALDVLLDPLGWVLVVTGTARLTSLDARFDRVRLLAVLAGGMSLVDVVQPLRTETTATGTSTAAVAPDGLLGLAVAAYGLLSLAVTVLLCLALRDRAGDHGDEVLRRRFALLAVLQGVLGGVLVVVSATGRGPVVVVVVGALLVGVWLILALASARHLPWLQDQPRARRSPAP